MMSRIPTDILKDPKSKFLDNSAGSGNFLIGLKNKLSKYHTEKHILNNMLYGVELMKDNHTEMCERLGVPTNHPHFVNEDALTYDYEF